MAGLGQGVSGTLFTLHCLSLSEPTLKSPLMSCNLPFLPITTFQETVLLSQQVVVQKLLPFWYILFFKLIN